MEIQDSSSLIRDLRTIFAFAALYYQASVAGKEEDRERWSMSLQGELSEARELLERVPNGDLTGVLDAFLGGGGWDFTADAVRRFLSQYLMERFEKSIGQLAN